MCTGRHPNESDPSPDDGLSQLGVSADVASAHLLAISAYRLSASTSKPPSMAAISTPLVDPKRALFEQTDFTLKTLVSRCRSQSPNTRPSLLSIGLQLNQIIVRHILPILPSTMNLLGLSSAQQQQQQRMAPPGIASSLAAAKGAPFSPYSPRKQISYRNRSTSSVRSVPDPRQVYPLQNPSSLSVHSGSDSTAHKPASYVDFSRTGGERDGMESRSWGEYTQPGSSRVATHASTARQVYTEGEHYVDLYGIDTASNQLDDPLSISTSSSTLPNLPLPTSNSTATAQNRPSSPPTLVYHAASPNIYQQVHSVNDPSSSQYWNATASGLQPPPLLTHQYSVPPPPPLVPSRPVPASPRPARSSNTQHPPHSPSPSPSPSPTPSPWVLPFVKHGGLTAGVQQPGRTR
ncbi:hypothetical protein FRC20_004943 [Serendipita sp. 405]|nr:hypothetical protein FRC20_004943 [Serendipita sp. 405]